MTIIFEPAPTCTTHFIRYSSGHVVWCKVGPGENDQLILKEWDSFNKFWVPGIHTVEHYESAGLTKIEDFPILPLLPVPDTAPAGATHCYHHAGEISWYRETADDLFVWRDGSWYASVYKKALDLANGCPLGAVVSLGKEKQSEQAEDQTVLAAQDILTGRRTGPGNPVDASGTFDEFSERQKVKRNDWYERGELPPVGVECEHKSAKYDNYSKVFVVGHGELFGVRVAFYARSYNDENFTCSSAEYFRPIRTERDEAIEAMKALCEYPGSWETFYKPFAEALYDAGYRAGGAA